MRSESYHICQMDYLYGLLRSNAIIGCYAYYYEPECTHFNVFIKGTGIQFPEKNPDWKTDAFCKRFIKIVMHDGDNLLI